MGKLILQAAAILLLCLSPFAGILIRFAPSGGQYSFAAFLIASGVFLTILFILACFVAGGLPHKSPGKIPPATWLFILTGLIFTIPLNMDAPPFDAALWLQTSDQQQFRFLLLILAYLVFFAGILSFAWKKRRELPVFFLILLLLAGTYSVVAGIAASLDSLSISGHIRNWIAAGNRTEEFFFHYRPSGIFGMTDRPGTYIAIIILCLAIKYLQLINIWALAGLLLFCLAGIIVSVIFLRTGNPEYYFPFMVPAIALAPAYWLGIQGLAKASPVRQRKIAVS